MLQKHKSLTALLLAAVLMVQGPAAVMATNTSGSTTSTAKKSTVITTNTSISKKLVKNGTFLLTVKTSGNGKLTFSSNNASVARVSSVGKVTMKSRGECTITVKAAATSTYKAATKKIKISLYSSPRRLSYSKSYLKSKFYSKLMKLKLTGNARNSMLQIAASQIGYHEGPNANQLGGTKKSENNYTEYGRFYGMNGVAWCAIFVNWCSRQNGVSTSVIPKYCAVRFYWKYFQKRSRTHTWASVRTGSYTPKKGDLIFYSNKYKQDTHHIGIVEKYSKVGNKIIITSIEGNSDDHVARVVNRMKVSNKTGKVDDHYITGFVSPRY